VNASEIGTGTETETETGKETGRGKGKERPAPPWRTQWVLVRVPFLTTSANANAIVWKARCIIAIVTAIVTVEGLVHIRHHSLPLRPRFHRFVNPVRVRQ
jgi:hypothetical protein